MVVSLVLLCTQQLSKSSSSSSSSSSSPPPSSSASSSSSPSASSAPAAATGGRNRQPQQTTTGCRGLSLVAPASLRPSMTSGSTSNTKKREARWSQRGVVNAENWGFVDVGAGGCFRALGSPASEPDRCLCHMHVYAIHSTPTTRDPQSPTEAHRIGNSTKGLNKTL